MKHVFYIGSHLLFYITHTLVKQDRLNYDDVILFLIRDYNIPTQYNNIYSNQLHTKYGFLNQKESRVFAGANIFKTRKNIAEFDEQLTSFLQGEKFIWYCPVCSCDSFSLMVTRPDCIGYYITEDGLASYRDINPYSFPGLKKWAYKLVLKPLFSRIYDYKDYFINTHSSKFKGCIATSQKCFPLHQEYLRVIGSPFVPQSLEKPIDAILSIDSLYLFYDDDTIQKIYHDLLEKISAKGYHRIAYKFHPNYNSTENKERKRWIACLLKEYLGENIEELSADIVLENVIMQYQCDFYTDVSSVCIYASEMHAHCYSYLPICYRYSHVNRDDAFRLVKNFCTLLE